MKMENHRSVRFSGVALSAVGSALAAATGKGMNRYDDDHYKQWPFPVTDEEIRADGYLKSLTPDEERAVFLSIRGHCLMAVRQYSEAEKCYAQAAQLAPASRGYRLLQQNASRLTQFAGKENP